MVNVSSILTYLSKIKIMSNILNCDGIFKKYVQVRKLNKSMIILALETLLEQVKDADDYDRIEKVSKELIKVKNTL
tara:strand:+ start:191 stop:418 length:228 start_codon:yes stop_codon:yes gene_type:complete